MAKKTVIPERFLKPGLSFIGKIQNDTDKSGFSSFCSFPQKVDFQGKDSGECVVLIVRRDPASLILNILGVIFLLLFPLFFSVLGAIGVEGTSLASLGAGGSIFFILLAITIAFDTFVKWFFSVSIITDQRIVDVDFSNVLFHRFSEAQLEQIEDVTHTVAGIWGSIFDYGTVYIQTAGSKPEFEFINIPRPRDVQDTLLDLLEMKQKGQI